MRLDIKHMLESKMALQKANAEIIRMNLKTNVVTKRKKDGNFFYAKEKGEILEANPHVSPSKLFNHFPLSLNYRLRTKLKAIKFATSN